MNDIREEWQFLGNRLGINLLDAYVKVFEVGELLQVPYDPKAHFATHKEIKGTKTQILDFGRNYKNNALKVKIYDA